MSVRLSSKEKCAGQLFNPRVYSDNLDGFGNGTSNAFLALSFCLTDVFLEQFYDAGTNDVHVLLVSVLLVEVSFFFRGFFDLLIRERS